MFQEVGLGSFYWWGTQWQPGDFPDLFGACFSFNYCCYSLVADQCSGFFTPNSIAVTGGIGI